MDDNCSHDKHPGDQVDDLDMSNLRINDDKDDGKADNTLGTTDGKNNTQPSSAAGASSGTATNTTTNSQTRLSRTEIKYAKPFLRMYGLKLQSKRIVDGTMDFGTAFVMCIIEEEHRFARLMLKCWPEQPVTTLENLGRLFDVSDRSPLAFAVIFDAPKDIIDTLLKLGFSPDAYSRASRSLITWTVAMNNKPILLSLLSHGANPNMGKYPPLHEAYITGHLELASILLHHGADPNGIDPDHGRPLHLAIKRGVLAAVRMLLRYGADVNGDFDKLEGWTPLHMAVMKVSDDELVCCNHQKKALEGIIKLLVENGADLEKVTMDELALKPRDCVGPDGIKEELAVMLGIRSRRESNQKGRYMVYDEMGILRQSKYWG